MLLNMSVSGPLCRSVLNSASALALPLRAMPIATRAAYFPRLRNLSSTASCLALKTRYTPEHEWVTLDSDTNVGTVGITDYAQKSLGDVVFVELPTEGTNVTQGGEYVGRCIRLQRRRRACLTETLWHLQNKLVQWNP